MPKISIITTTYKHEKFVRDTIESVLAQTFTDWELLIGDDNSPDKTYEIVLEYAKKDSRIKVWKNPTNLGIVGNMNLLLSQISPESKYITFLEGDDMYTPENLEEKMKILGNDTTLVGVISHVSKINAQGEMVNVSQAKIQGKVRYSLIDFLKLGNPIQSFGAVIFKKSLLEKYIPFILPSGEKNPMFGPLDYWLWTNIIPNNDIYFSSNPYFLYRVHPNNFVKNVSTMNNQLETIYQSIISKNTDISVHEICHRFIIFNRFISDFFDGKRLRVFISFFTLIHKYPPGLVDKNIMGVFILNFLPKSFQNYILHK